MARAQSIHPPTFGSSSSSSITRSESVAPRPKAKAEIDKTKPNPKPPAISRSKPKTRTRKRAPSDDPDDGDFVPDKTGNEIVVRKPSRQSSVSMYASHSPSTSRPKRGMTRSQTVGITSSSSSSSIRRSARVHPVVDYQLANDPSREVVVEDFRQSDQVAWHDFINKVKEVHEGEPDWSRVSVKVKKELQGMIGKIILSRSREASERQVH